MTDQSTSITSPIMDSALRADDGIDETLINRILAYSFVDDHEIKGGWRYFFLVIVCPSPLVVFIVMMWFQLYSNCAAQSTIYGIANEDMIQQFIGQNNIHYCASAIYENGKYFNCNFASPNPTSFDFSGPCSVFQSQFASPYNGGTSCVNDDNDMFQVFYYQCTPVQTAIVNSVQYALYTVITVVYMYLFIRVITEFGIAGLFRLDNWSKIIFNKKNKNDNNKNNNVV
eukprot:gene24115-32532_t